MIATLQEIEHAVTTLHDDDFRKLYAWIIELDHQKWDEQIAHDAEQGLLDTLANQALEEYRQGTTTRL